MIPAPSTVLIVDDEPTGREALGSLFHPPGWTGSPIDRIVFAGDGATGLESAAQVDPDLILLDLMLPGMDGLEVCRRLRGTAGLAEVPILLVTALDDRAARLSGIEAGADDFISKPFDRAEVRARIATILRLDRHRRLHAERDKLSWVIEDSEDGYLILARGDRIEYANACATRLLGLADEPSGTSFRLAAERGFHLEPVDAWERWPALGDEPRAARWFLVRPETDAAPALWLELRLLEIRTSMGTSRVARLRDVTAQVVSSREVRSFHWTLSHKFRTPLNGLVGSLSVLTQSESPLSREDIETFGPMLRETAARLEQTVLTILEHLRLPPLAARGSGLELARLPAVVAALTREAAVPGMTVEMDEGVDAGRLRLPLETVEYVLGELLDNAVKFHPRNAPRVRIQVSLAPGGQARLRFHDDCPPLPAESLGRVWTPYFQHEKRDTGEVAGVGLGLSTIAAMVWAVGGRCRMLHDPDRPGNVVELVLPLE